MPDANDPRDTLTRSVKEWEEFRATLAAAVLHAWLLTELDEVAPDYFVDLRARFTDGFINADLSAEEDPYDDRTVPVRWAKGGVEFFDRDFAEELQALLFPHPEAEGDFRFMAWGLAVVALQAALEAFAQSHGIDLTGGATAAIRKRISETTGEGLDALTADRLADCEATRHLFAHNRGIVDEAYIRRVPNCHRVVEDRRDVNFQTVMEFARAVRRAAAMIQHSSSPG